MKPLIKIIFFLFTSFSILQAQTDDVSTFYQVRLGAYVGSVNFASYDKVADLGKISVTSIKQTDEDPLSDTTNIYLGIYLGRATATRVLEEVKIRGYEDAFLEYDGYELNHSTGKSITHAVQIGAFKQLRMKWMQDLPSDFYILYEKGYYKIFSHLFSPNMTEPKEIEAMKALGKSWELRPFVRQFRLELKEETFEKIDFEEGGN